MSVANLLKDLISGYDPSFDVESPDFVNRVVAPLEDYVGASTLWPSTREMVTQRLKEQSPEMDLTVFGDLFAKPLEATTEYLLYNIRTSLSKRSIQYADTLTGDDLTGFASNYAAERLNGSKAIGSVRLYFNMPRYLSLNISDNLQISHGGQILLFRTRSLVNITSEQMRAQREGASYYVDIELESVSPGMIYNIPRGAASTIQGIPGLLRAFNVLPFENGTDSDDGVVTAERIKTAITYRGYSNVASGEFLLPELGVERSFTVRAGSPLMLRDRIFWEENRPVWIPGGLVFSKLGQGPSEYLSLGIAYDVWVKSSDYSTPRAVTIENIQNKGIEVLTAEDGQLAVSGSIFTLTTKVPRFSSSERVGLPEDMSGYNTKLRPVRVGNIVEFEGQINPISGEYARFEIQSIPSDDTLNLLPLDGQSLTQTNIKGSAFRVLSDLSPNGVIYSYTAAVAPPVSVPLDLETQLLYTPGADIFTCIPLTSPRCYVDGEVAYIGGDLRAPAPGTERPDLVMQTDIRIQDNIITDVSSFPSVIIERLETSALGDSPRFLYPRDPLFIEVIGSKTIAVNNIVTWKVRFHFQGPTTFVPYSISTDVPATPPITGLYLYDDVNLNTFSYTINRSLTTTITNTTSVPTDTFEFYATTTFADMTPEPQKMFAVLRNTTAGREEVHPIKLIETLGATHFKVTLDYDVFAPFEDYELLQVTPGIDRSDLASAGRGVEGTYQADMYFFIQRENLVNVPVVPTGTPVRIGSQFLFYSDGFTLVSPLPGLEYSKAERPTLVIGTRGSEEYLLDGTTLTMHALPGQILETVQEALTGEDFQNNGIYSPIVATGLARLMTPTLLTIGLVYEGDLSASRAASLVYESILSKRYEARIEVSDIVGDLYGSGATYVLPGRLFGLQYNDRRQVKTFSTRGAITRPDNGEFLVTAITCMKMRNREIGESLDNLIDQMDFEDVYTLLPGGYDGD